MNHSPVTPLPIHFKTLGRSYSQIGRKGNVALYAVYSDYWNDRFCSLPYVLLGFELIVIKTKNGEELYPADWQFGKIAWSIPKLLANWLNSPSIPRIPVLKTQPIEIYNRS